MRSLWILLIMALVFASAPARGEEPSEQPAEQPAEQEKQPEKAKPISKLSATAEIGYVFLTAPYKDTLKGGAAFGASIAYRVFPFMDVRLPLLYSFHEGKALPSGGKNELELLSLTPGVSFTTTGRLAFWFFLGAGPNFQRSKFRVWPRSVTEDTTSIATRFEGGVDYKVWRTLYIGAAGDVFSSSADMIQANGIKRWDTFVYYAALGRIKYSF